jgi:DNA-directed RNA polymerase subunit N (RpoN/RPB10)
MLIPIRCFTCGKTLADKYDWYVQETEKLRAAKSDDESKSGALAHFDSVHTGPLLDKLGLTRCCCRRHMLGQVDMMDSI